MLIVVAPGQGAQSPGFLAPWLQDQGVAGRVARHSEVCGLDLADLGTEADADAIRDTAVAQPLLVATGLAVWPLLWTEAPAGAPGADALAGHSVGEITAAGCAGVLDDDQALTLVRERGSAMAEAAAARPTGMTAVLGGDRDDVLATLERHGLTPANDNGPGQVVAAGTTEQLAALADDPPAKARLTPLSVAGAFHTEHMAPAVSRLEALAATLTPAQPRTRLLSNRDGEVVGDGADVLSRLVGQIAHPVRWDLCLRAMADLGVTGVLELPPAGTLTAIAKRQLRGVETFAWKSPDQLDEARAFCARHAGTDGSDA